MEQVSLQRFLVSKDTVLRQRDEVKIVDDIIAAAALLERRPEKRRKLRGTPHSKWTEEQRREYVLLPLLRLYFPFLLGVHSCMGDPTTLCSKASTRKPRHLNQQCLVGLAS